MVDPVEFLGGEYLEPSEGQDSEDKRARVAARRRNRRRPSILEAWRASPSDGGTS